MGRLGAYIMDAACFFVSFLFPFSMESESRLSACASSWFSLDNSGVSAWRISESSAVVMFSKDIIELIVDLVIFIAFILLFFDDKHVSIKI